MKKNVLEYLEKAAEQFPNKLSFADTNKQYTYGELLSVSKRIGSYVAGLNIKRKAVMVYMDKCADNLAAFFGSVYGGAFYVPIDSKMPVDRINKIADTLNPGLIIFDKKAEKNVNLIVAGCTRVSFDSLIENEVDDSELDVIRKNMIDTDPLYVLFTSGSTGNPKGVVVCHRSVIDYAEWLKETFDFDEYTIFGNQTPFYFSMSVLDIYATIASAATLWIIPKMNFSFPIRLLEFMNEKEINTIYWVPSALSIVANIGALEEIEVPFLKKILFAGEVMPTKQLNMWRKYVPSALYANLFGPTEITDIGVYYIVDREFADDEAIPIGQACDNVGLLVVDDEGKEITTQNKPGELLIRGSFLAHGYFNNLEKTAEAFIQNPTHSEYPELVYKTGDVVYYNERNELVYKCRKDFQIKHMGNRIELGEIETAFSAENGVDFCCCVYNGAKDSIIGIYVGNAESNQLAQNLKNKLPTYMLPNEYVHLSKMPMNANGKIDRAKLNSEYCN